jgi:hypothetical protein
MDFSGYVAARRPRLVRAVVLLAAAGVVAVVGAGGRDPARARAAETFVAWARGRGDARRFARRVRNMLAGGDHFGAPRRNDRPGERGSWAGCSGLGFPDCGLDPVAVVLRERRRPRLASGRPL